MFPTICPLILLFTFTAIAAPPPQCKILPTTFEKLTIYSEYVVLGQVVNVRQDGQLWVAELQVRETLKGDPKVNRLFFLATPTWDCDISGAKEGETGLYFLSSSRFPAESQPREQRFLYIAWAGRGRMPLREVRKEPYVTVWVTDVELPPGIQSVNGPRRGSDFIRSVRLSDIRAFVLKVKEQEQKPE